MYSPMADVSALGETASDGSTFKFAPDLASVCTAARRISLVKPPLPNDIVPAMIFSLMVMPVSSWVSLSHEIILRVSSSSGLTIPDRETVRGRHVYFGDIDMSIAVPPSLVSGIEEGSILFCSQQAKTIVLQ